MSRTAGNNTTTTKDRVEPVEEENEGQRKITEFLLVGGESLSTQELIIDARARKANRNKKLECEYCEFNTWSKTMLTKHVERSHPHDREPETSANSDGDIVQDEPVTVRERKHCEDCGFRTTSDDVLSKHNNIKHRHKNKSTIAKNGSKRHTDIMFMFSDILLTFEQLMF